MSGILMRRRSARSKDQQRRWTRALLGLVEAPLPQLRLLEGSGRTKDAGYKEDEQAPHMPTTSERLRDIERKLDILVERFDQHERWAGEKAQEFAAAKAKGEEVRNEVAQAKSNIKLLLAVASLLSAAGGWLIGLLFKK